MMQDDEAKRHPQCDRRNDEEINGGDGLGVIVQKGPPGLRCGRLILDMYFATVDWETSIPSLSSSP
jgi:hypothetical protein